MAWPGRPGLDSGGPPAPAVRTVALDLRGHGLSDAPTTEYDPATLADDVVAVAEGSGLLEAAAGLAQRRVVLVGHGFGGMVAAWAAAELRDRCAGLVLVDGGWQDVALETGTTPAEFLRDLAEPPEVLSSIDAYLDDRRSWDVASWDADEERAARATVVEVPAGHVVPAIRPHALELRRGDLQYRPLGAPRRSTCRSSRLSPSTTRTGPREAAWRNCSARSRRSCGRRRGASDSGATCRYRPATLAGAIP
jgi:pimeloyl-ACP methyl ester carboxylesterase